MTLADILVAELNKAEPDLAPAHKHIARIGRELARKYNQNLETLGSIAGDYVKASHEIEAIKARSTV